eukprot:gene20572-26678_t
MFHRKVELLFAQQEKTQMEISDLLEVTRTLKTPYEALKNMKVYVDIDSLVEELVTDSVASKLLNPKILHRTGYSFESWTGGIDGVVIGKYINQDVIVFCESKHDIDSCYKKAVCELISTLNYWEKLKLIIAKGFHISP